MTSQTKTITLRVLKIVVSLLILGCVVWAVRRDLAKAPPGLWSRTHVDWLLVCASALCLGGMNTVQMLRYRSLLYAYGAQPTWTQMCAIAWIPPLGKYVPGSVWALMGAIAMLKRFGINAAIAVSVVIMVDAFSEIVGLIFSVPLLLRPPISDRFPAGRWIAPALLVAGVIVLAPPVLNPLLRWVLRLLKRPPLDRFPTLREYAVPVGSAIKQWLFAGASLWLMARAFTRVDVSALPQFVMVAACAMAVGYLAFFTSAGLGPREWIFVTLLPPLLLTAPAGTVTLVTIAMRVAQIMVELALAGLGAVALRMASNPSRGRASR